MDSAADGELVSATGGLCERPSQHSLDDNDGSCDLAADGDEDDADDATAILDAAADFIGLVRDNDVETLRLGVDKFGSERARAVCCTVETRLGGLTAFTLAAELGHQDIIALFVKLGADVNSRNSTGGWTPLHCAVSQGFTKVFVIHGVLLLSQPHRSTFLSDRECFCFSVHVTMLQSFKSTDK